MRRFILTTGIFFTVLLSQAEAKTCKLSISGNDQMQFSTKELKVEKDCAEISVTLTHAGKLAKNIMGHNWILAKTSDVSALAADGMKAGADKGYLPTGDKRILAHTKLLAGGESETITIKKESLTAGGDYTFFCSFPGHVSLMQGKLIVQ